MHYLGVDFGLTHIGLSSAEGPLAGPLTQKTYHDRKKLLNFLHRLCQDEKIEAIVFGLPEGKLKKTIKDFAVKLCQLTHLPIYYQDETLSTHEAKLKLIQAQAPLKKRRQDHRAAATLILQSFLDEHQKD